MPKKRTLQLLLSLNFVFLRPQQFLWSFFDSSAVLLSEISNGFTRCWDVVQINLDLLIFSSSSLHDHS